MSRAAAHVRGDARRDAIRDAIGRVLDAGLPLEAAALAGIAVRDAQPWAIRLGAACWPLTVPLGGGVTLTLRAPAGGPP